MLTADNFHREKRLCDYFRRGLCRYDEKELVKCSYKICEIIDTDEEKPDDDYDEN